MSLLLYARVRFSLKHFFQRFFVFRLYACFFDNPYPEMGWIRLNNNIQNKARIYIYRTKSDGFTIVYFQKRRPYDPYCTTERWEFDDIARPRRSGSNTTSLVLGSYTYCTGRYYWWTPGWEGTAEPNTAIHYIELQKTIIFNKDGHPSFAIPCNPIGCQYLFYTRTIGGE